MSLNQLSSDVFLFLNGENLENKQHDAMIFQTVSENGWPHTAMLSVGEVVALNPTHLRFALWKDTTTIKNILRTNKASLVFVHKGVGVYINLGLVQLPELKDTPFSRERFEGRIVSIKEDRAGYADLTSGITFQIKEDNILDRWNQTIQDMFN